jgi:hypothetical protein
LNILTFYFQTDWPPFLRRPGWQYIPMASSSFNILEMKYNVWHSLIADLQITVWFNLIIFYLYSIEKYAENDSAVNHH